MIEIALGIVLAVILLATIEYWLPVVLWLIVGLAGIIFLVFLFALVL